MVTLSNVFIIDSKPLRHEIPRKYCHCMKDDVGEPMVFCDGCSDAFHCACVGLSKDEAEKMDEYTCGYCLGTEKDGKIEWVGEVPIPPGRVRRPKPKIRIVAEFEDRKSRYERGERELAGPSNWEELVALTRKRAKDTHEKEASKYAAAVEKQKQKDHHVNDIVTGGRVEVASVSDEMIDFLQGMGEL